MKAVFLLNKASGGNERGIPASGVCTTVEKAFSAAGHDLTSKVVEPARLEEEIGRALRQAPDAILVGGGDGSVSTAARLLGGTSTALGIIPMGTFNLAARDLGVSLEIETAAAFLAGAEIHPIDVLEVAGHSCLCTTIFGFYPEFSSFFEKRDHGGQWWRKAFKLASALPRTFSRARFLPLVWDADGTPGKSRTKFSAFVPGAYRSSAGIVPSRTDFQSGTMTAYIGTQKTPASALGAVFDYVVGRQEKNSGLVVLKARSIELRLPRRKSCSVMLDGEILRLQPPIHLKIQPRHLNVLTTAAHLFPPE